MNALVMKLDTIAIDLHVECLNYNYFSERTDLNFYLTSDIYSFTRLARLICFILIQIANNEIYLFIYLLVTPIERANIQSIYHMKYTLCGENNVKNAMDKTHTSIVRIYM